MYIKKKKKQEKAKRFKVVVNGPFEESEFYIDIG